MGHAVIAPKGSRVDHTTGEYTSLPSYYFSYAVAQLKKKKITLCKTGRSVYLLVSLGIA